MTVDKPEHPRRATLVYIAGRGHSGSTLLDAMLGSEEGIESVGELVSGMGRMDALCSCGEAFRSCDYWAKRRQRFETTAAIPWRRAVELTRAQANVRAFARTALASPHSSWVQKLRQCTEHLVDAIAPGQQVLVDSSKEISRALFLLRFVPGSKIIHLVRHPERILASNYFRLQTGSGFGFMRRVLRSRRWAPMYLTLNAVSWTVGNALARVVRRWSPSRFITVRYEDLVDAPLREIDRLEDFLGVRLERMRGLLDSNGQFEVGHNIGGNHMRMRKRFRLDPGQKSSRPLPLAYRLVSRLFC